MVYPERDEPHEGSTSCSPPSSGVQPNRCIPPHGGIPSSRSLRKPSTRSKSSGHHHHHRRSRKRMRERSEWRGEIMGSTREVPAHAGRVYHVGTNSLGYPFCTDRFLVIKGIFVTMFKRNPVEDPQAVPIRSGVVGTHLMVEEVGRQVFHGRALYVLRIFNRLDHSRQGEFACNTAEEVEKWVAAFKHAKEEAEFCTERLGSNRRAINIDDEFNINGPRIYSKSVQSKICKLITTRMGPTSQLRQSSMVSMHEHDLARYYNHREEDTVEQADWRCFCIVNGLRIFEAVTTSKAGKGTIMKAVGVIEANPETIFEQIMSLDNTLRHQWDVLTSNFELVEQIDGHSDIVYGSFNSKHFKRFCGKQDFLFSRYWRRDQDGSYSITQVSTTHKSRPSKPCVQRIELNPGIWEITPLPPRPGCGTPRSLVTQVVEVKSSRWGPWKQNYYSKFQKTIPYFMLCRIAGLRELFGASPQLVNMKRLNKEVTNALQTADPMVEGGSPNLGESLHESTMLESHEEFYDAIMVEALDGEEDELDKNGMRGSQKAYGISWASRLAQELEWSVPASNINPKMLNSSLKKLESDEDVNGWSQLRGKEFMVRGPTYNEDNLKISGGEPLLKLLAVDWLSSDQRINHIALQPNCCVQSTEAKKAPFILLINLQVPAKPNYYMVLYYVADKPIQPRSLLDQFVNGDGAFRNSRFKLIPRIVEGYWMVKRAVGTKACLLGKAITCNYLRKDNFLEIDVDIGSSSVARSVLTLVLGYLTSIVVDLAILIEAIDTHELPEYLLGTVRINRINIESAIPFDCNASN